MISYSCNSINSEVGIVEEIEEKIPESITQETSDNGISSDKFMHEDGKFRINFPGNPTIEPTSVPTDYGNIEMMQFTYEKSITEIYMVAYSDYPSAIVAEGNPEDMINNAKNGFLGEMGMTLEEEKKIEIDGNPGLYFRAYVISAQGNYYTIVADYLVNNRLYQVAMIRDGSYPSRESEQSFINSFELVK